MKMRKAEHFTRSSSSIQGQAFNVKFNAKMFETLFSTLYRYKEAASLRETLCNAIDSHSMRDRLHRMVQSHYASLTPPPRRHSNYIAPKGKRVVVHLPDDFEPWLEIRDYGIGLSLEMIVGEPIAAQEDEVLIEGNVIVKEDEIPESSSVIGVPNFYNGRLVFRREDGEIIRSPGLYTTLFHSTKEEDDGQIGAFGLGSKSPFAVSDSFTVESRMEGKLHRFLMYLNADRIPTVDLITKDVETRDPQPEDTDEFNGMTVKIPIKNSRFSAFSDELIRLGRVIAPENRPEVENASYSFQWEDISYGHCVNRTYIQPKSAGTTHYAVMGGVSYPIELAQLDEETSSIMSKFPSSYTFFELGSLNVPPSREDLTYDEFTRETLSREFKVAAKAILVEKMAELELACARGPMALFLEKNRLSEMFGSGFRKMVEKEYPADKRFNNNMYIYPLPVEMERDYDHHAPFDSIGHPFTMEVHQSWGTSESLKVGELASWKELNYKVAVIVEDSLRARNLKVKQTSEKYDVTIVVKVNDRYLQRRNNTKDSPAFKNWEELEKYYQKWVGTEETTVDYLAFGDAFVEFLEPVLDPTAVLFMSEVTYTPPPVDKDPGMFRFDSHGFTLQKWNEVTGDDISTIINKGERIVFVEVSGHNCIHEVRGKTLAEVTARMIRDLLNSTVMEVDADGKTTKLSQYLNIHDTVFLARRKSVPMMKKFPEVFVPIDEIFEILVKHNRPQLERENAIDILKAFKATQTAESRFSYGTHLCVEAFGKEDERYQTLQTRHTAALDIMKGVLDKPTLHQYKTASKTKFGYRQKEEFSQLKAILEKLSIKIVLSENDNRLFRASNMAIGIYMDAQDRIESLGFSKFRRDRTPSRGDKSANRRAIECHRVVRFLKENYVPTAHNLIQDANVYMDVISKQILRA